RRCRPEAIAVSLLHSYAASRHERVLARALAGLGVHLTLSHRLVREHREYERTATVVVNAYVGPPMTRHLGTLARAAAGGLQVMQSSGGLVGARTAATEPVRTILSGPAAGVVGAAAAARLARVGRDRAVHAVGPLARRLGRSIVDTAAGIVRVATATMERAVRVITVERGIDPRDFTLVAFGGAGGAHAAELAGELGLPRVYVPRHPGLLSAYGALTAETIRDFTSTLRAVDPSVPVLAG